jgi:heme/copper-type cytochrome/quinol oxidase subunit 2
MYSNKPILFKEERRIKADILSHWLEISSIVVWVALFVVIVLWQNASPQAETLLDSFFNVERSTAWNFRLLNIIFYLFVFLFVFSAVSIFLNFKRLKRSTDRIRLSFILSIFGSTIGILIYLFAFAL